ncbi:MAG TPA: UDP-N-acetylglucosamine--N-acetylmuramyl-(pentapeptide) pyrophosphoryl-undecaprenol N-acetylglucosamine transferase [Anaerolineales bacterium]|nr:UDP-N-acetylglucosamine--N-acetylmuramyl-(pentapeptide) pyrophosphoryl-undecaprenol N-acetylglucosamine transferase [Anaerolineales bacterium]
MRLLICAGGTGGGVYPALSVLKQLMSLKPEPVVEAQELSTPAVTKELQVLWVGSRGGMEADLVKREGIRFEAIPAAGVHGVSLRSLPGNLWRVGGGFFASRRILRKFRPDVLFFTGGYVAVPMALAARLTHRSKSVLYVPDLEPGLALKTIARFSDCILLTVDDSQAFFPKHPCRKVTGYPIRPGLDRWSVEEARNFFALQEQLPVLLVFGGSKGARSINQALAGALPELLNEMQVIHITGKLDWQMMENVRAGLPNEQLNRYRPYPYLYDEIGAGMLLADLALSRAGASTLGEYPLFGLPAILVPYPYAWRYQRVNASYLVKRGAAEIIEDAQLAEQLLPRVRGLMADQEKRDKMSTAMQSLAKPEAATRIAGLITDLAISAKEASVQDDPNPTD